MQTKTKIIDECTFFESGVECVKCQFLENCDIKLIDEIKVP